MYLGRYRNFEMHLSASFLCRKIIRAILLVQIFLDETADHNLDMYVFFSGKKMPVNALINVSHCKVSSTVISRTMSTQALTCWVLYTLKRPGGRSKKWLHCHLLRNMTFQRLEFWRGFIYLWCMVCLKLLSSYLIPF